MTSNSPTPTTPSASHSTTQLDSVDARLERLTPVLPADDPRIEALKLAKRTRDVKLAESAIEFCDRTTAPVERGKSALRSRLLTEAASARLEVCGVIDIASGYERGANVHDWIMADPTGRALSRDQYVLAPQSPLGDRLAVRLLVRGGLANIDHILVPAVLRNVIGAARPNMPLLDGLLAREAELAAAKGR